MSFDSETFSMRDRAEATVTAFIASYRDAYERGGVDAIIEHFGESVHVASDTGAAVRAELCGRAEWRVLIERLVSHYRALDVGTTEVRSLEVIPLSSRLMQASVTWALFDRRGHALYEFGALYTLACEGASCRIVAIAHDELSQSRQLHTRRGSSGG